MASQPSTGRALRQLAAAAIITFAVTALVARPVLAHHLGQVGSYTCTTAQPTGFSRVHGSGSNWWNPCSVDSYGPPEWIYSNIHPDYTGYNNPGANSWYSQIADGISRWSAVMTEWQITYQSGDWNAGTDLFVLGPI